MSIVDRSRGNVKERKRASGTSSNASHARVPAAKETQISSVQRSASTSPPPLGPSTQYNSATYQNRKAALKDVPSIHRSHAFDEHETGERQGSGNVSPFRAPRLIRSASINDGVSQHELSPDRHITRRPYAVRSASGRVGEVEGQHLVLGLSPENAGSSSSLQPRSASPSHVNMKTRVTPASHQVSADEHDPMLTSLMHDLTLQSTSDASHLPVANLSTPSDVTAHPFASSLAAGAGDRSSTHKTPYPALQQPLKDTQLYHDASDVEGAKIFSEDRRMHKPVDLSPTFYTSHNLQPSQSPTILHQADRIGQACLIDNSFRDADAEVMKYKVFDQQPLQFHQRPPFHDFHPDHGRVLANAPLASTNPNYTMTSSVLPPSTLQSLPQGSYAEHATSDPRQVNSINQSSMFSFMAPVPFDQNAHPTGRSALHTHVPQQFLPYPALYRGTFPTPAGGLSSPMMPAPPPHSFAYHERNASVTTQGSVTPPFTPSPWQAPQMMNGPYRPPTAAWPLPMAEMSPQHWRGGSRGGSRMQHRRMQSGPSYPPITPLTSPHVPLANDRRTGSNGTGMHTRSSSSLSYASLLGLPLASQDVPSTRSPLLEEFRSLHNRGKTFELNDIRGAVLEFSTDQHGSRFTQDRLVGASEEAIQMVFDEVLPAAPLLMVDVFGNYVVQKLIEHGTPEMRQTLLTRMKGKTRELSFSTYGCRVVQRMLDCVDRQGRMQIAEELKDDIETFICDQNANHVVQKVLERSKPIADVNFIPQVFAGNVKRLASHCYSCRVLQRIFEYCDDAEKRPLMAEMLQVIRELMQDRYGNYVVQWILREGETQDKHSVIASIKGDVLALSTAKCASNVVEKAIERADDQDRFELIEEVMRPVHAPYDDDRYVPLALDMMMKDQYGNYVLQCCISHASEEQCQHLLVATKRALTHFRHASGGPGSNARHLSAIQRLVDAKSSNTSPPSTTA